MPSYHTPNNGIYFFISTKNIEIKEIAHKNRKLVGTNIIDE
jgi:hypothetical protein